MNWYDYVKKYVWNAEKTPYFIAVDRLSKTQARNELFTFAVLLAVFCMVLAIAALLTRTFQAQSAGVALYAFTVFCAAVTLGAMRHYGAALYCSTAPPAALFYFVFYGFPPHLQTADKVLIVTVALVLLRYTFRIVAMAKIYPTLPKDGET